MNSRFLIKKRSIILLPIIFTVAIQFYDEVTIFQRIDATGIKHILLLLYIFVSITIEINRRKLSILINHEIMRVCFVTAILVIISFFFMTINGISKSWISEVYFMIVPILFISCLLKDNCNEEALEELADLFLLSSVIGFVMHVIVRVQRGNIQAFSFVNSSSPFEVESAHLFMLLYVAYTYLGKTTKRFISAICCILAWKRMTLIFLLFVTIFHRKISVNRNVSRHFLVILTVFILFIPLLIELVLTETFSDWFIQIVGVDLHKFMMFRFEAIVTALESTKPNCGLGSFLYVDVPWYDKYVNVSIHNDIIRLYLEVTPIGLACFSYGYLSIAKNQYSFLVMGFMFVEMICSHFLGNGTLPFWILAFGMIYCFNRFRT